MPKFLLLLMAFLFPMIDGDEPEIDASEEAELEDPDGEEADEPEVEAAADEPEGDEPEPEEKPRRAASAVAELRRRTQQAEKEVRELREAITRSQGNQMPPPNKQLEEEERKLADPETTPLEKWQIQSNRTLRQSNEVASRALAQAQDLSDRTMYAQKAITNAIYQKYEKKVEDKIAEIRRSNPSAPPREVVLWTLLGKDMADGTFKAKTPAKTTSVPRGKSPGARSDTPARGGSSTEHQKRTARLQNTQI